MSRNVLVSCFQDTVTSTDNLIGKTVGGRYEGLKLLGYGGASRTLLVYDVKCNKVWAMQVYDKNNKNFSPAIREALLQEPRMMMNLKHMAIPAVVDIIEDDDNIFIVREYIEGETLDDVLRDNGPVPADTAVMWAKLLCDVLGYLHKQNPPYIYRDMKPANIILKPDGNLKLINFGAGKVYDITMREQDICYLATKGYAAPEQYGGWSDARSDIYALGMTLHHLVTGLDPNQLAYETEPIRAINPNFPMSLESIISRCVQINPDDRFQSCDELMIALEGGPINPPKKGLINKIFGKVLKK